MLELRPTCEHCNASLPPNSTEARICSYECTFCSSCVESLLGGVCPNCGGDFVPRPIRPARSWREGTGLSQHPARTMVMHAPIDLDAHALLLEELSDLAPERR
jgi:uncharacterized protein